MVIELQYWQLNSRQNCVRQLDFPLYFCVNCNSFKGRGKPTHRPMIGLQYVHLALLAPSSTPCFRGTRCPYFAACRCLFSHVACQVTDHDFAEYQSTDGLDALSTAFATKKLSACVLACSYVESTHDYALANLPHHSHNSYGRQRPPVDPMPSCFAYDQQLACAEVTPTISVSDIPSSPPRPQHQESNGLDSSPGNGATNPPLSCAFLDNLNYRERKTTPIFHPFTSF